MVYPDNDAIDQLLLLHAARSLANNSGMPVLKASSKSVFHDCFRVKPTVLFFAIRPLVMIHLFLPMKQQSITLSGWSSTNCGPKLTTLQFTLLLFHKQKVGAISFWLLTSASWQGSPTTFLGKNFEYVHEIIKCYYMIGVNFFEKNSGYFNTISKKLCEYVFAQVSWVIKHSHSVKRVSMWWTVHGVALLTRLRCWRPWSRGSVVEQG